MGSRASHGLLPRPDSSRSCTTIATSGRATAPFAATSIRGAKLRIGGGRSRFWNRCRKSTQRGSAFGAPATPGAMCWCSARLTAGSGLSSRKCPRSAATSKACAASRQTLSRPSSVNSTMTSVHSFAASRLGFSKWSTPSIDPGLLSDRRCDCILSSASAARGLEERGDRSIGSACKDVRTRPLGSPGLAHTTDDDCRSRR